MSDRDTLITAIADEIQRVHGTPHRVMPDASASNVLAALDRLGYRVVGPAERVVKQIGRKFDMPSEDEVIPWSEQWSDRPCPATGTINGYPVHRVARDVIYTAWRDDSRGGV